MNVSFIHLLERMPMKRHVWMKAKSTFPGRTPRLLPTMVPGNLHDDGSGLPISIDGSNICLERPVIWWMSAKEHSDERTV
jgi:hypothetical protein